MRLKLTIMAAIGGITAIAGIAAPAEAQPDRHHGYHDGFRGNHGYYGRRHYGYDRHRRFRHYGRYNHGYRHGYHGRHH